MSKFQKMGDKLKYAALVPGVFLMSSAMAQEEGSSVVDAVEGAVTAATADVKAIGLAIIGVVVAVVAFNWIRRVIR